MRTRYNQALPLSQILDDLLSTMSEERGPRTGVESRTDSPTHDSGGPESQDRLSRNTVAAAPGCSFPFVALLIGLLILAATIPGAARGQTILSESFDAAVVPDLPSGWIAGQGWATSTSSASNGSGLNNLAHTGMTASEVSLPALDLAGASSASLSFLARRTSSYLMDAMRVTASLDGGSTWPIEIIATGSALPSATSTWEPIQAPIPGTLLGQSGVMIRFEVSGGTTSGANVRLDDVLLEATGGGSGSGGSSLGFSDGSSVAPSPSTSFYVGMRLDFDNVDPLGALQMTVTWDSDLLSWAGAIPGVALSDPGLWTVSSESVAGSATVLIISPAAASLPTGIYDPVIQFVFDVAPLPGGVSQDVTLTVSDVIGALAVSTGDDAGISTSTSAHLVTVSPAAPDFDAPDSLDLGIAAIGQTVIGTATVSNTTGIADLVITDVSSDNPVFDVVPTNVVVAPGGTFDFSVSYTPDGSILGSETANLSFTHNGANGPVSVVSVSGQAGAGRGDANGDAHVDLLDLLLGIDVALGRVSGSGGVLGNLDLYPFPSSDGFVDVRDLTILAYAIVQDAWPDGESLPAAGEGGVAAKASDGSEQGDVTIMLQASGSGLEVWVRNTTPIKGLQFELLLNDTVEVVDVGPASEIAPVFVGSTTERIRFLWARFDGSLIPEGDALLAVLRTVPAQGVRLGRSLVVDSQDAVAAVALWSDSQLPGTESFRLGAPYPNPFSVSDSVPLHIPVTASHGAFELRIVDLLGREIQRIELQSGGAGAATVGEWTGRDRFGRRVTPGIYFVRARGSGGNDVRAVVVTR